jgi:hypothetical protein
MHMTETRYFDVACPSTGETVRAGLNASELFTQDNLEVFAPETQLWWSSVVRQYQLDRDANPTGDPAELFAITLRAWPEIHPVPQV